MIQFKNYKVSFWSNLDRDFVLVINRFIILPPTTIKKNHSIHLVKSNIIAKLIQK